MKTQVKSAAHVSFIPLFSCLTFMFQWADTAPRMSSSATTLSVNPWVGRVTARTTAVTTLMRIQKSVVRIFVFFMFAWIVKLTIIMSSFNLTGFFPCVSLKVKFQCPPTRQFRCHNDRVCLPLSKRCDGVNNCGDNSDEHNCCEYFIEILIDLSL